MANMLDYKVVLYEQLLGTGLTLGLNPVAKNMEKAAFMRNLPRINRECGIAFEARVEQQLIDEGFVILGRNVGARTSDGGLRFIDRLVGTPIGQIVNAEIKSGNAVRNAKQLLRDQLMATQGATLVGKNAPPAMKGKQFIIPTIERR